MNEDTMRYQTTAEKKPFPRIAREEASLRECSPPSPSAPRLDPPTTYPEAVLDPLAYQHCQGVTILKEEYPTRTELADRLLPLPGEFATVKSQSGETLAETVRRLIPDTPSVMDIAEGLSTELRWGGQTIVPWSVLHHILAGLSMVDSSHPLTRLKWLLHEVDEIYTGDIGKLFKTLEQRAFGEAIQEYIFEAIVGVPLTDDVALRCLDVEMAVAEAYVLCPPGRGHFVSGEECVESDPVLEATVYDMAGMDLQDAIEVFAALVTNCIAEVQHGG